MESKLTKLAQAATLCLALALTFSCSSSDDDEGGGDVLSSSSVRSSAGASSPVDCVGFVEGTKREHYGMSKSQFCDSRDGKRYVYVDIGSRTFGTKTWMAENLNYNATGSKCYEDNESNCNTYGRLYNWATAKTACPSGWHLPTDDEWMALMRFLNPICSNYNAHYCPSAGTNLKATSGWYAASGSTRGTDDYGFAALPGGWGDFDGELALGVEGSWWSANEFDSIEAHEYSIYSYFDYEYYENGFQPDAEDVFWGNIEKYYLFSVRCVRDDSPSATSSSSIATRSSSSNLACTAKDNDDNRYCYDGSTMKEYGFVTDEDGQDYKTVVIGTQTWMAENLNYNASGSRCYGEGNQVWTDDDIPIKLSNAEIQANCAKYGRLYDFATAKTACPSGWHLPSDADWNVLMKFINPNCSDNFDHCDIAGMKLRSANGWNNYVDDDTQKTMSGNGTDNYGFTALPGGAGDSDGFLGVGNWGLFWSSSEKNASGVYSRFFSNKVELLSKMEADKGFLLSVRCIKGN